MKLKLEILSMNQKQKAKRKEERKDIWLSLYAIDLMGRNVCRVFAVRSDTKQKKSKNVGVRHYFIISVSFFPALVYNLYQLGKNRNSVIYKQSGELGITHSHTDTHRQSELPTQLIYLSTYQQSVRLLLLTRVERAKIYLRQLMLIIILNLNKTIDICRH